MYKSVYFAHIGCTSGDLVKCVVHVTDEVTKVMTMCISKSLADKLNLSQVFLCQTDEFIGEIMAILNSQVPSK
jgi:hypothetical protein